MCVLVILCTFSSCTATGSFPVFFFYQRSLVYLYIFWYQVVKVHQDTVNMYLEDVILGSINQTADAQAREEIHRKAEELDNITYAMEETYVSSLECYDIQLNQFENLTTKLLIDDNKPHALIIMLVFSAR